jgi:hypothetical protein
MKDHFKELQEIREISWCLITYKYIKCIYESDAIFNRQMLKIEPFLQLIKFPGYLFAKANIGNCNSMQNAWISEIAGW